MPKARGAKEAAFADNDVQQDEQQGLAPVNAGDSNTDDLNTGDSNVLDLSYEKAFDQLEQILVQLEGDDLALDQSLELYEQGVALVGRCSQLLDSATLRVQQWQENGKTTSFTGWQEG